MGLTLEQLKKYTVGVLQSWLQNKSTLDKISETENGSLLFNGKPIQSSGGGTVTEGKVGRKLYPLTENNEGVWMNDFPMTLTDSISNYNEIIIKTLFNDVISSPILHYPTELITIGTDQIEIISDCYKDNLALYLLFNDETTISTYKCKGVSDTVKIFVYGVKYETVTEDPVTDAEVEQAKTETVEELNAEKSQ